LFDEDGMSKLQFGFTYDIALTSSMTIGYVTPPSIMALDPRKSTYAIAEVDAAEAAEEDFDPDAKVVTNLKSFAKRVMDEEEQMYGGRGWSMSFRRVLYELLRTVATIWLQSPLLACLVFGLPTLVISFICYALCCMETLGDPEGDMYKG
jgi:thioredoxin domain-containing protein 10